MDPRRDVRFDLVDPRSDAARAAMSSYFEELDSLFPTGFDPGDALTADAPSFDPPSGAFLVVRVGPDGDPVTGDVPLVDPVDPVEPQDVGAAIGCGGLLTLEDGVGEIKRMWIAPAHRGRGLARVLLAELEGRSRALGHRFVRLDTNAVLTDAIRMYEGAGYHPIGRYNDNPYAERWFEKPLR